MLAQLQRMFGPAVRLQIGRGREKIDRHVAQPACHQRGIRRCRDADGGVESVANDVDQRVAEMQVD